MNAAFVCYFNGSVGIHLAYAAYFGPFHPFQLTLFNLGSFSSIYANVRGLHLVQVLAPLLLGAVATVCICYPSRQAATLAQARMSRMVASAVSARMSNMKRILAHGGWLLARKRSAPCVGTQ